MRSDPSAIASWEDWDEFLETAASHPLGGVALDALSVDPGCENDRALLLEEIPTIEKTTPEISKFFDPGLVTREGGEDGHLAHLKTWRPLPCFPERAVRNNYSIKFSPLEKNIIKPNPHKGF